MNVKTFDQISSLPIYLIVSLKCNVYKSITCSNQRDFSNLLKGKRKTLLVVRTAEFSLDSLMKEFYIGSMPFCHYVNKTIKKAGGTVNSWNLSHFICLFYQASGVYKGVSRKKECLNIISVPLKWTYSKCRLSYSLFPYIWF